MATITLPPSSTNVGDLISSQSNWTGNADNLLNLSTSNYVEFNTNTERTFRSTIITKYDVKGAINPFSKINYFGIYSQSTVPTNVEWEKMAGNFIAFKHRISAPYEGVNCDTESRTGFATNGYYTTINTTEILKSNSDSNLNPKWNNYYYSYDGWNELEVCNTGKCIEAQNIFSKNYKYRLYTMPLIVDYTPPSLITPTTLTSDTNNDVQINSTIEVTYNLKAKIYQKTPLNINILNRDDYKIENVVISLKNNNNNSNISYDLNELSLNNKEYNIYQHTINLTPIISSNAETNLNISIILTLKGNLISPTSSNPYIQISHNILTDSAQINLPKVTNPVFENINTNNFEFTNERWFSLSADELPQTFELDFQDNNFEFDTNLSTQIETPRAFIGPIILDETNEGGDNTVTSSANNELIKKQYLNRKILGKSGNYDEQTSLHLILKKDKMVTLQGLVDMDRPTLLDLCPECSEDDPFNHRGYAVIYDISNMKIINEDYAEADVKLEYIERNLKPLVNIQRGSKVNTNIVKPDIPDTTIKNNYSFADNFLIECSGDFSYDGSELAYYNRPADEEDTENRNGVNKIELEANESFLISKELTDPSDIEICFEHVIPSSNTNFSNAERIIRLKNKETGETVFEYSHINFQHKGYDYESENPDEIVTLNEADVTCTVFNNILDEEISVLQDIVQYDYDIDRDEEEDYSTNDNYFGYWAGTRININIDDNILNLTDDGFTGAEINIDDLEIEDADYILEFETRYDLISLGASPLLTRCGIEVTENVSSVNKKSMYSNMIVSPNPLSGRNLYFIRNTEEGALYYYSHDGYNGTYITHPSSEYKNGVNLQSGGGAEILSLKNNPNVIIINNGLVKVKFDRYYSYITISKYREFRDYIPQTENTQGHYKYIQEWQDICNLKVNDIQKISIISYNADKIILDIGGTTWTLWRGRPFIEVIHPKKNIKLMDKFDRLWNNAETINLDINKEETIDYGNYPYVKLSESKYKYNPETNVDYRKGIGIIRPNYADITSKNIPMNSKTVFMPYFEQAYEHDTCENMILEYINLRDQTITMVR
ncbi:MAG: hypothetical protein ISP01_05200 [Methanobrevibacter arboriphilus]|uniref:Uncharacterized protein n=1 Tax=Methanobrevibacter arboriphilus TaxID=39441 RepID=A0A843ADK0_METAZ|nr:hypothetical protein [Methanobrevibacter arboriphilus]MBF4468784.1 hypothetical protein [Methanobrevibacter arboriphilus]